MAADSTVPIFRVRELELRYKPHRLDSPFEGSLDNTDDVAKLAESVLGDTTADAALVLHLSKRLKLLGVHRPPIFPDRETAVADIFRAVLLSNAHTLIYVHHRANDDVSPSPDDRIFVHHIRHAARIFGAELRDAVIVSNTPHEVLVYSFRDNGVL